MGETNETNQGNPPATGQTSGGDKGSTSKTLTIGTPEYEKHKSDILTEGGRKWKKQVDDLTSQLALQTSLASERDPLKVRLSERESEIADLNQTIEALQEKSPDGKALIEAKKALKKAEAELKTKETGFAEREKKVIRAEFKELVTEIAGQYENGDSKALLEAVDDLGITTKEKVEAYAKRIGWKVKGAATDETGKKEPPQADSGANSGGGKTLSNEEKAKKRYPNSYSQK